MIRGSDREGFKMPDTNITSKFTADVSSFKKGITEANKAIKLANAEFKAASAGMDDWSKSTNGIQAKIKQLQSVLTAQTSKLKNYQNQLSEIQATEKKNADQADKLRAKLKELADSGVSKTSAEYKKYENALKQVENEQEKNKNAADKLKVTILNQQGTVNKITRDMRNYKQSLDSVDDETKKTDSSTKKMNKSLDQTDKSAKKAKDGFTVMKGAAASLIANGIQRLASAITDQLGAAVERVDTINQYKRTMENLGYSQKEVAKTTDELKAGIDGLPTTLPAIMSQQQQYAALSGDISQATKLTVALNDATLAGGQGQEKASRAMQAWYKIIAAGKPTQQRWMIINSSMPAQMNQIASAVLGTGKKSQDLFNAWKDGKVKTEQITKALIDLDKKGGGGMASFKKQAGGATKGIGTSITNVRTAITNMLADILEAIGSKNIASFFGNIKAAINDAKPKITAFFSEWAKRIGDFLKSKDSIDKIATAIKILLAAFVVSKVASFISSLYSAALAVKAFGLAVTGAIGPAGLIISIMGAVVAAATAYGIAFDKVGQKIDAEYESTDNLIKKNEELIKSYKEGKQARKDAITEVESENAHADILAGKIEKLRKVENKSASQKKEMKNLVKELNKIVPDLGLKYDAEKDKLNKSSKAIAKNIERRKELAMAKAFEKAAQGTLDSLAKEQVALKQSEKELEKNQQKRKQYSKTLGQGTVDAITKAYKVAGKVGAGQIIDNLIGPQEEAGRALLKSLESEEKLTKQVKEHKKAIKDLNGEYKTSMQVSDEYTRKVNFDDLAKKAKKAGVSIPKELKAGMLSGQYEIPSSVNALQNTIKFDKAIQKAGIDAKNIPKSIKNGITSGKTSVKAGVAQANRWVDFKSAKKNAKLDGAKIPKFLKNQIINGKVSTKKAVSSLSGIVKFRDAVNKANKDGKDVPKSLVKGVNSGKTSVKSANKQLNRWIEFKDAAKKAGVDSKDIPKKMRNGILSGKTSVKSAVKQLSSQTKNNKESKANGESAGKSYSDGYAKGIKSGKTKVYKAGKEVGKSAHKGAKDGTHSKSPSKDAIKLGGDYDKGLAIGLEQNIPLVSSAGRKVASGLNTVTKKFLKSGLFNNLKTGLLSEIKKGNITGSALNAFNKGIDKQVKRTKNKISGHLKGIVSHTVHEASKKNKSKLKSAGKSMISAFSSGMSKEASKLKSIATKAIQKITDEFNNAYSALIDKRSSLDSLLKSTDLFVTDPHGDTYLADLKGYNAKLGKVGANLNKIKGLGFSNNLLDEIAQMDVDTQLAFTTKLLQLSPAEQKAFNAEYVKKEKQAKQISDNFYANRIAELKKNYSNKVTAEVNKLKVKLDNAGKNAVDGLIKGLKNKKKKAKLKGAAADLAHDIIRTVKKELKISSPSRVMAKLFSYVPEGAGRGIRQKTSVAVNAMQSMVSRLVSAGQRMSSSFGLSSGMVANSMAVNRPAFATGYGSTNNSNVTNVNYNQVINSPSPVSALDNYRNTKNALNQLKRELK